MLYAANISTLTDVHGTHYAIYAGNVQGGDSVKLDRLLIDNPQITHIMMISDGGLADEGPMIGQVLSNHQLTAYVPEGRWCMSACAEAFLGAADYIIDGALGFHVSWINPYYAHSDVNEYLRWGQFMGSEATTYYVANGFSFQFAQAVHGLTSKDKFMTFFHEDDLKKFYVRKEGTDEVSNYFGQTVEINETWIDFHIFTPERLLSIMGYR